MYCSVLRPYHAECTGSRLITEVKQHWSGLVLGWVTTWEWVIDGLRSISNVTHLAELTQKIVLIK